MLPSPGEVHGWVGAVSALAARGRGERVRVGLFRRTGQGGEKGDGKGARAAGGRARLHGGFAVQMGREAG